MVEEPLRRLIRRPWRDLTLPSDAVGIPTMLSKDERRLLYGLAREHASGEGAIVDAGCFLGGSTAALCFCADRGYSAGATAGSFCPKLGESVRSISASGPSVGRFSR